MARYLAGKDPGLKAYLQSSLMQAQDSSMADKDLAVLRILVNAIGGAAKP